MISDEILSVVADIGQLYLKSGFTGDDCPRYCTFSKCTESFQFGDEFLGVKPNQNIYDVLLPFNPELYEKCVDSIYKAIQPQPKGMETQPKELSLLLANNFQTKADLQKVVERIFENLSIPNFFTVRNPVLSTFSAGRSSALVLDIGAYQSQAAAVHEGYTLIKQTVTAPIGGEQLNELLAPHVPASLLVGKDPTSLFKQNNQLRDIKEALIGFDGQGAVTKYDLQDGNSIQLSTSDTIEIAEKLFQHKDNFKGIDHMLIDVVNSSLADLKSSLCGSVLVTGGSSAIPGLMNKLNNKLQPLAPSLCKIKLIQYPSTQNRQHSVFIGGSILASLSSFQSMWIGKGEYQEQGLSCLDRNVCFICYLKFYQSHRYSYQIYTQFIILSQSFSQDIQKQ
ncbi:hypothetical protein pb186bvf_009916 [Paramecium bursaria]